MTKQRKIFIAIELILIVFLSSNFIRELLKNQPLRKEMKTLKLEFGKLQNENKTLRQRLLYLENPENKKKEIRDKLNLGDPNEKVIILPSGF